MILCLKTEMELLPYRIASLKNKKMDKVHEKEDHVSYL
jgi:hypothetical protein